MKLSIREAGRGEFPSAPLSYRFPSLCTWVFSYKYLILLVLLNSCARFGLKNPSLNEAEVNGFLVFESSNSLKQVESALLEYLKARDLKAERTVATNGDVIWTTAWQYGPSLRYYFLEYDQRSAHFSRWKEAWTLRLKTPPPSALPRGRHRETTPKIQIEIAVLEHIHYGPRRQDEISYFIHSTDEDLGWLETDPDRKRSEFLRQQFETWQNSRKLISIPAQNLNFAPLAPPDKPHIMYQ